MFGTERVINVFINYFASSIVLVCFLIALVWIYFKSEKKTKMQLLLTIGLFLVLVANDVIKFIISKLTDDATFYRFFWCVPVIFVFCYVVTRVFQLTKARDEKIVFGVLIIAILLLSGKTFLSTWEKPDNRFQVSDDTLYASIIIDEDCEKEQPVVALPYELHIEIRRYDPSIIWAVKRATYLHVMNNGYYHEDCPNKTEELLIRVVYSGMQENTKTLKKALDKLKVDYLVISNAYDMQSYLEQVGCVPVGDTGNYCVYRYNPN